jgi:hypothetical protein
MLSILGFDWGFLQLPPRRIKSEVPLRPGPMSRNRNFRLYLRRIIADVGFLGIARPATAAGVKPTNSPQRLFA